MVANSGWEDEYPAKDLEVRKPPLVVAIEFVYYLHMLQVQSPFIKGWRSPRYSVIKEACECVNVFFFFPSRFCLYPQELVVQIDPPCRIRKIQLLSHQYLIAHAVDLHVGHFTNGTHTSISHAKFTRLGYISLSDNETNRFKV